MRMTFAVVFVCVAIPAHALTVLTAGKVARLHDRSGTVRDSAVFAFGKDRALAALIDPRCPGASSVQISSNQQDDGELPLPCVQWKQVKGGFLYKDRAGSVGGVRRILYRSTGLVITVRGSGYTAITGPVGYVQVWLTIGDKRYVGRFHDFRENKAASIVSRRPSVPAAEGEAMFWDTLFGDAERADEAIEVLGRAVKKDRRDGWSIFLLGMAHLLREGRGITIPALAEVSKAEADVASELLDRAVPLLPHDTRIPGFRGAATYLSGHLRADAGRKDAGLMQLRDAFALNPLFNTFDFIGVVSQLVAPTDPVFAEGIGYLNVILAPENLTCVTRLPEVCANRGLAPNNLPGSLTLFGDLYAKDGDLARAQMWYGLGAAFAGSWKFKAVSDDRVANAAARVAAYQDADPTNDPPLVGLGGETCAYCHNK